MAGPPLRRPLIATSGERMWEWKRRSSTSATSTLAARTCTARSRSASPSWGRSRSCRRYKHVWRPDFFGSVLFLAASAFALSALGGRFWRLQLRALPWWIAWLNMLGSVAFMASAIGSFVVPSTDTLLDLTLANAGTLVGAMCFLVGAALMPLAWRASVRSKSYSAHPAR